MQRLGNTTRLQWFLSVTQPHQSDSNLPGLNTPDPNSADIYLPDVRTYATEPIAEPIIPSELMPLVQELCNLYAKGNSGIIVEAVAALITGLKRHYEVSTVDDRSLLDLLEDGSYDDTYISFLKSWQDILGVEVYIDTDIYDTLNNEPSYDPVALSENLVKHQEATAAYLKSWTEVAEKMADMPDDIFTRYWSTTEMAKFLNCSPKTLRKARIQHKLPLKVGDLIVNCADTHREIAADRLVGNNDDITLIQGDSQKTKKILWFVRKQ